jgi:hypothetical protein
MRSQGQLRQSDCFMKSRRELEQRLGCFSHRGYDGARLRPMLKPVANRGKVANSNGCTDLLQYRELFLRNFAHERES